MNMKNFFKHLHTVNRHRFIVCKLCFKLGLYWQGLTHDLSKYSLSEFWPSLKYYRGDKSPILGQYKEYGYSEIWLHHKGRNRHHWEYWMVFLKDGIVRLEMPEKYIREMVCDRIAACMVYEKDKYHNSSALEFLEGSREKNFMPPNTYATLKKYLTIVAENDLDTAMKTIRNIPYEKGGD